MRINGIASIFLLIVLISRHHAFALDDKNDTSPETQSVLSLHNDNYLLFGRPDTKIQVSFKLAVIPPWNLYLGYTQLMFMNLGQTSTPMADVNFNPEVFHRVPINVGILKNIDLSPFEHLSNGHAGPDSRSWDRAYFNFKTEFALFGLKARWDTKVFYIYAMDKTNSDLRDRLGYFETSLVLPDIFPGIFQKDELKIRIAPGGTFSLADNQGFQEVSFKFRVPIKGINPYVFFQIHNGMHESLLRYSTRETSYRIGLSL